MYFYLEKLLDAFLIAWFFFLSQQHLTAKPCQSEQLRREQTIPTETVNLFLWNLLLKNTQSFCLVNTCFSSPRHSTEARMSSPSKQSSSVNRFYMNEKLMNNYMSWHSNEEAFGLRFQPIAKRTAEGNPWSLWAAKPLTGLLFTAEQLWHKRRLAELPGTD